MSKEVCICDLKIDDEFTDFFMVRSLEIKIGANHKSYLDITVSDKSAEINGKKWDVSDEEAVVLSAISEGDLVKIKGSTSEWNGTKQLRILRIRKAQKEDNLDIRDFIKAAPEDPEEMYAYILKEANAINDEGLKKMAVTFLTEEKERLMYYPAAMKNHHAELGGLLWHIKRMLMMGKRACEVYTNLDKDWIVCGVILHDMEKLNEIESNLLGVSSGYSMEGQLLGHIAQGVKAVDKLAEKTGLENEKAIMLEHMVLSHHYEPDFGSPRKPMFPEAELLHYLDMVDAKMFDFEAALTGVEPGTFSERQRTLDGRMLYKPSFDK